MHPDGQVGVGVDLILVQECVFGWDCSTGKCQSGKCVKKEEMKLVLMVINVDLDYLVEVGDVEQKDQLVTIKGVMIIKNVLIIQPLNDGVIMVIVLVETVLEVGAIDTIIVIQVNVP